MSTTPCPPHVAVHVDATVLELERERLFGRLWIFAGFAQALATPQSYFARRIAGVPVLLRRTAGGLRAFLNQCAHRGMPLQHEGFGEGATVCPYHGWSYDGDGRVEAIPNKTLYGLAPGALPGGLRPLALRRIGDLLFVNLADDPMPIETQFAPEMIAAIETLSEHLDREVIHASFPVRYNWKLNMENVKDGNHVPFVHARGFATALRSGDAPMPAVEGADTRHITAPGVRKRQDSVPALSALSYAASAPVGLRPGWWAPFVKRFVPDAGSAERYYNWFLYPNVNLASVNGLHFLLQQFDPVAPDRTDFHLWMMTARRTGNAPDITALLRTLLDAERRVIEEDVRLLESMQAALGPWTPTPVLGAHEAPLAAQQRWHALHVLGEARP